MDFREKSILSAQLLRKCPILMINTWENITRTLTGYVSTCMFEFARRLHQRKWFIRSGILLLSMRGVGRCAMELKWSLSIISDVARMSDAVRSDHLLERLRSLREFSSSRRLGLENHLAGRACSNLWSDPRFLFYFSDTPVELRATGLLYPATKTFALGLFSVIEFRIFCDWLFFR